MNLTRVIKNIFFLLVSIFSGLTLVVVTAGVTSGSGELDPINFAAENALVHFRTPLLNQIMVLITNVGSPFILSMITVVLAIILVLKNDIYDTMLYIVSMAISIAAFMILKDSLDIPRPEGSLVSGLSGSSFPSGHATVATAFFFATAYSFFNWAKHWPVRISFATFCIIGAVLVAFSRIYLRAHLPVDVLGGISLGLLTVSFTILVFNIFLSERTWWRKRVREI